MGVKRIAGRTGTVLARPCAESTGPGGQTLGPVDALAGSGSIRGGGRGRGRGRRHGQPHARLVLHRSRPRPRPQARDSGSEARREQAKRKGGGASPSISGGDAGGAFARRRAKGERQAWGRCAEEHPPPAPRDKAVGARARQAHVHATWLTALSGPARLLMCGRLGPAFGGLARQLMATPTRSRRERRERLGVGVEGARGPRPLGALAASWGSRLRGLVRGSRPAHGRGPRAAGGPRAGRIAAQGREPAHGRAAAGKGAHAAHLDVRSHAAVEHAGARLVGSGCVAAGEGRRRGRACRAVKLQALVQLRRAVKHVLSGSTCRDRDRQDLRGVTPFQDGQMRP